MCGDFNVVQNYVLDNNEYDMQTTRPKARKAIFEIMDSLDLIDIYRSFYEDKRWFTWRKPGMHLKQARLEYFLISSDWANYVEHTTIKPGYRSDHSLILSHFTFKNHERGRGFWKFNNSLLYDPIYVQKTKE